MRVADGREQLSARRLRVARRPQRTRRSVVDEREATASLGIGLARPRASPARVFLPQRGDRWVDVPLAPASVSGIRTILLNSRWLRTSALREERVHLFNYTEDAETARSEGPPLPDDTEVAPGDRIVLWMGEEDPSN